MRRQPHWRRSSTSCRRVHGRRLGRAGVRTLLGPSADYGLDGTPTASPSSSTRPAWNKPARRRAVVRLRPGDGALPPPPRLPRSLVLASAYAGWAGSLGRRRRRSAAQWRRNAAERPLDEFVREFSTRCSRPRSTAEVVDETIDGMISAIRPAGLLANGKRVRGRRPAPRPAGDRRTDAAHSTASADKRAPVSIAEELHRRSQARGSW